MVEGKLWMSESDVGSDLTSATHCCVTWNNLPNFCFFLCKLGIVLCPVRLS